MSVPRPDLDEESYFVIQSRPWSGPKIRPGRRQRMQTGCRLLSAVSLQKEGVLVDRPDVLYLWVINSTLERDGRDQGEDSTN